MEKPSQPTDSQSLTNPDTTQTADADLSGQVLDDYRILRRLGQGGMGQVYLAQQISLRRQVALKVLKPELAASPTSATSLARFKAEAEVIARATHCNILQIYAIGQAHGLFAPRMLLGI